MSKSSNVTENRICAGAVDDLGEELFEVSAVVKSGQLIGGGEVYQAIVTVVKLWFCREDWRAVRGNGERRLFFIAGENQMQAPAIR